MVDYGTGAQAALAISAALHARQATGEGRFIDVAMSDCALMLMNSHSFTTLQTGTAPRPHGNQDPALAGYSCYDTADGQIMLGAYSNRQNAMLMRALGNEEAAAEIENLPRSGMAARRDRDAAFLSEVLRAKGAQHWEDLLNAHHVPAARVRSVEEALEEEQYASRRVVQEVAGQRFVVAGFAYDRGGPGVGSAPPEPGEHTEAVLSDLGVSPERQAVLRARGVIG
jgi:crotonobetainyl-CoA:carnitine CoA-transferase CaiB-like acyl-CoA transferase